ncbi:MAG TPA: (2Fe-2S)-binding protein [Bacilli bacterium]|jgi:carbon-monoxide dehydrogenase small subunit|nr:(2Fe-2S)-binding protein [Bacilli bacterium]NCA94614.1 (2Fe-2S)-binding protein [Campylobacterota bacterium]NLB39855.1 (2Fe-2S)-binding protein [Erysipelotrichaceae bacterium]MDD4303804.1 (2Fe-2S)-binding protein [Bacilli bacterium]HNY74529.1 (2Fe-2S)-binding protein [Bacilli bacterium]
MNSIKFNLNGQDVAVELNPSLRLLDVLRDHFHLTGTKEGCGEGECGACSVLINGRVVNSCCFPLANANGKKILTIEGLAATKRYQILKDAFHIEGGSQCGICTPGMIMAAESLLSMNPHPTDEEIRIGLSGNLCRCTGYNMIIKAVKTAAKLGEGLW